MSHKFCLLGFAYILRVEQNHILQILISVALLTQNIRPYRIRLNFKNWRCLIKFTEFDSIFCTYIDSIDMKWLSFYD